METTKQDATLLSRFVTVAGVEYVVELKQWAGSENLSVSVEREPEPGGSVWRYVFGSGVEKEDGSCALDWLRSGLTDARRRMNRGLEGWRTFRAFAAAEPAGNVKGSKRAYYSRLANDSLKRGLEYAPHWKLAKQLWKEITRL